jgi:hypothetical protein
VGHGDDVRAVHELRLEGVSASQVIRHALRDQSADGVLVLLAPGVGADPIDHRRELGEGGPLVVDGLRQPLPGRLDQVPARGRLDQPIHPAHQLGLDARLDHAVQGLDRLPSLDRPRHVTGDAVGPDDDRQGGPRLSDHP